MIEYVIGGVLHGADTKDQIKVGEKIPYFDSLEFFDKMDLTIFPLVGISLIEDTDNNTTDL